MADRALVDIVLLTEAGAVRPSISLVFYEENGSTPLAQSLYAAQSGGSPLVAPYQTNSAGTFRAYAPNAQNAVCVASDDASNPFPVQFQADQADEILTGQSDRTLASLILGPDQTTDIPLIVKGQVGQTANLAEWRNSSGTVLHSMATDGVALTGTLTIQGTVTAAKIQAALDAGYAVIVPDGTHTFSTKITVPVGGSIRGMGDRSTILSWTGSSSGIMFEYSAGSFTPSHISIRNLCLSTSQSSVVGIRIINGGFETLENLSFFGVATHFYISGGFRPSIRNVYGTSSPSGNAGGSYFASMPQIDINGYTTYGTSTETAVLTFNAVAAGTVSNINLYSPATKAIILQDNCQGLIFTGGVILAATTGILVQLSGGSSPTFCEFIGYKIDQCTVNSVSVSAGGQIHFTRCEFTNMTGSGTLDAVALAAQASAVRITFNYCTFENITRHGINAAAGAGYFAVTGCRFISSAGTGACLNIGADASSDVYVAGNWMRDWNTASIIDAATSGSRRYYLDNAVSVAVSIATPTGAVLRDPGGFFGIGDCTNALQTLGLTINQGAADDEILTLKSSDVAHGITQATETDTYALMKKYSATDGGLFVQGFCDAGATGIEMQAWGVTNNTTKSTAGLAALMLVGTKKNGTSGTTNDANSNLVAVADHSATRFILDSDGDSHQDAGRTLRAAGGAADDTGVGWTNYDTVDDLRALDALAVSLARDGDPLRVAFLDALSESRSILDAIPGKPIVSWNDGPDDDGHAFINMSRLTMLLVGAVRQVSREMVAMSQRLDALALAAPKE